MYTIANDSVTILDEYGVVVAVAANYLCARDIVESLNKSHYAHWEPGRRTGYPYLKTHRPEMASNGGWKYVRSARDLNRDINEEEM